MGEPEEGQLGRNGVINCLEKDNPKGCLATLIQLASTPFEKEAVIEFATLEKKFKEFTVKVESELKTIKYLISIALPILIVILTRLLTG